jgi:hypothetical protein
MMDSAVHMGEPPPNYDFQEWNRTYIYPWICGAAKGDLKTQKKN